jgi:hypothetical protein
MITSAPRSWDAMPILPHLPGKPGKIIACRAPSLKRAAHRLSSRAITRFAVLQLIESGTKRNRMTKIRSNAHWARQALVQNDGRKIYTSHRTLFVVQNERQVVGVLAGATRRHAFWKLKRALTRDLLACLDRDAKRPPDRRRPLPNAHDS